MEISIATIRYPLLLAIDHLSNVDHHVHVVLHCPAGHHLHDLIIVVDIVAVRTVVPVGRITCDINSSHIP